MLLQAPVNEAIKHDLRSRDVSKYTVGQRVPGMIYGKMGVIMSIKADNGKKPPNHRGPGALVVSPLKKDGRGPVL